MLEQGKARAWEGKCLCSSLAVQRHKRALSGYVLLLLVRAA